MRCRGTTLLEVMVAAVLVLLVMGTAYCLLVLVLRAWSSVGTRTSLDINAQVALERMRHDLQESTTDRLACGTNDVALLTARDAGGSFETDADGLPVWQALVVYYVDPAVAGLRRRRISPAPAAPAPVDSLRDGSGTLLVYQVSSLSAVCTGTTLTLGLGLHGDGNATLQVDASVLLRNSQPTPTFGDLP